MASDDMKSAKLLGEFTGYCLAHPEERFWQALRNWTGMARILADEKSGPRGVLDTFYWEDRNG